MANATSLGITKAAFVTLIYAAGSTGYVIFGTVGQDGQFLQSIQTNHPGLLYHDFEANTNICSIRNRIFRLRLKKLKAQE